jgi:hypothetical protein
MFAYPPKAKFDKVLPKNKIYGYAKPSRRVQDKFVQEIEQIVWLYKLAPETINLPTRGFVEEIEVFDIRLKDTELCEDVLLTIDKAVVHPIFFQLHSGNKTRYAAAYKRPSEADSSKWVVSDYFLTDWKAEDAALLPLPVALDMNALYEQLLRAHVTIAPRTGESLREQVERIGQIRQKEREAVQLEADLRHEKQFNRKVDINALLRQVKTELQTLYLS